jgi:hypothetical protein
MNPIARMMKSYINMPLKKALPLLFICAILLVSITGCTSSTNTSSSKTATATVAKATPIAMSTPTATASFDPLLTKLIPTLKAEYGNDAVTQRAKGSNINYDAVYVNFESNGHMTTAEIRNEGSTDAASSSFETFSTCISGDVKDPGSVTHFGQQAATIALGHTPTTVNDVYCKGTGKLAGVDNEYIQYDQLLISTTFYV